MVEVAGPIDDASILLYLIDYRVITATHEPAGQQVLIEPVATKAGYPSSGVLTTGIPTRGVLRVRDLPNGRDGMELWVRKRRMACHEPACERRSFVQTTAQLPFRAKIST